VGVGDLPGVPPLILMRGGLGMALSCGCFAICGGGG
jgi:hypothetical protein